MLSAARSKWIELRDVLIIGINFCLLFSAYATLQSYQTSVNGKRGFYSLAVLYIVFGVSALLAPAFVRAFPLKPVLIAAASTYVLFIGVSIWGNLPALLIVAVIIGVGASFLWTAQATYVVRCSNEANLGRNTGAFYSVWQVSIVLGFVLATIFLAIYNHPRVMFIFLTAVGGLGVASMLLLREPPGSRDPVSFQFLLETVQLFKQPPMLLIAGLVLFLGARGGLVWGALPARFPAKLIGYTNIVFGVAEVLGGLTFGKLSDRIGRKPVLFLGYFIESCALALSGFARSERMWACYTTMFLFGLSDSILQVVVNAVLPVLQPKKTQAAFGSSSAMLFAGPYIPFDVMQLVLVALLVTGIVSAFILDRFVCRIDPSRKKTPEVAGAGQNGSDVKLVPLQVINGDSSLVPNSPAPTPPASPAPLATAYAA